MFRFCAPVISALRDAGVHNLWGKEKTMVLMTFYRMIVEISFYYSFAGAAAAHFGGNGTVLPALLLSVCYILSEWLENLHHEEKGRAGNACRYLGLLPAFLWLTVPGISPADRICFLFPLAYLAVVVYRKDFTLSRYCQMDLFSVFWKAYAAFALVLTIFDAADLLKITVPAALLTAVGSILLLRSLRHGPEVSLRREYQLHSLLCAGFLIAAAWALSRDSVLQIFKVAVAAVWNHLLVPVLTAILVAISVVMTWIFQIFRYLLTLGHREPQDISEIMQQFTGQGDALAETASATGTGNMGWQVVFFVIGILALAVIAIAFFRWLLMRSPSVEESTIQIEKIDHTPPPEAQKSGKIPGNTPIRRIREQYRSYLKFFIRQGGTHLPSDTTLQLAEKTLEYISPGTDLSEHPQNDPIRQMREIYLRARYREEIQEADPKQMKKQTTSVKKLLRTNNKHSD